MSSPMNIIDDLIRQDRNVDDITRELGHLRGNRYVEDLADEAIKSAELIDTVLRPRDTFAQILQSCYIAIITKSALDERLNRLVTREFEDLFRTIDEMYYQAEQESRRTNRRDERRDNRRDDRNNRDPRNHSGGSYEPCNRHHGSSSEGPRGFSKRRSGRDKKQEKVEVAVKGPLDLPNLAIDVRRYTVKDGEIVESYEAHELQPKLTNKEFSRVTIEEERTTIFTEIDECKVSGDSYKLETYASNKDFVNGTADSAISIGLIVDKVNFTSVLDSEDAIRSVLEVFNGPGGNFERFINILELTEKSEEVPIVRLHKHLESIGFKVITAAFNMNSKVSAKFSGSLVSEYRSLAAALRDNTKYMEKTSYEEYLLILDGLISNWFEFLTEDDKFFVVSKTFAGKVGSNAVACTSVVGSKPMARVNREYNPQLDISANAVMELRDKLVGDAWSKGGLMPVVITDSSGESIVLISAKTSDTKWVYSTWPSSPFNTHW